MSCVATLNPYDKLFGNLPHPPNPTHRIEGHHIWIFCSDLHFSCKIPSKIFWKCTLTGVEAGHITILCRSGHFIQFLEKPCLGIRPHPMGMEAVKHDFMHRYGHCIEFLANIFVTLPPPNGVGLEQDFSVQIWTFHAVPSKRHFCGN